MLREKKGVRRREYLKRAEEVVPDKRQEAVPAEGVGVGDEVGAGGEIAGAGEERVGGGAEAGVGVEDFVDGGAAEGVQNP